MQENRYWCINGAQREVAIYCGKLTGDKKLQLVQDDTYRKTLQLKKKKTISSTKKDITS